MGINEVIELDDDNWVKIIEKSEKPIFVMLTNPTRPYSKQIKPSSVQYTDEYKDNVIFAIVDIVKTPAFAFRFGVLGTPTFKFFCKVHQINEIFEDSLKYEYDCAKNTTWKAPDISVYA
ncbi:MAG: thioredoxin domain-containing protein [Candidatus Thermoplasmatota archaeon]|jgi:thioredoxin-like negative regulator of GroEL|nr:thioredoxin domain-containing protein [Candidatus Thermoplasmatota archaeon]